jgi:hypothetical protein
MSNLQIYGERLEKAAELARSAQILRDGERVEFGVLKYSDLQSLIETLEDLADAFAIEQARHEDTGERIPIEDVLREFDA